MSQPVRFDDVLVEMDAALIGDAEHVLCLDEVAGVWSVARVAPLKCADADAPVVGPPAAAVGSGEDDDEAMEFFCE